MWFKSLSAESRHKKCCLCFHGISLPPHHSVNTQKTPRKSDRTGWSPAAPMKHPTSHQCVNDFLPFRRKKSGGAPDVWHFILTFAVFLLQWADLFCSLCCRPCLLPLNPPSHSTDLPLNSRPPSYSAWCQKRSSALLSAALPQTINIPRSTSCTCCWLLKSCTHGHNLWFKSVS